MKPLALVLGAVFLVCAVLYWIGALQVGAGHAGPHHSHAILCLVLSALMFVWFRFQLNASPGRR